MSARRAPTPPLTVRACADWMGMEPAWIRAAIDEGVRVRGKVIKLRAETVPVNGRRWSRVHLDQFIVFLHAIGWQRVPTK